MHELGIRCFFFLVFAEIVPIFYKLFLIGGITSTEKQMFLVVQLQGT